MGLGLGDNQAEGSTTERIIAKQMVMALGMEQQQPDSGGG